MKRTITFLNYFLEIYLPTANQLILGSITFFLMISFLSCSQNQSDKNNQVFQRSVQNNAQEQHRKITLHVITASSYGVANTSGEPTAGKYNGKTVSTYNISGVLSEIQYYSPANELLYKESNVYDSTGKLIAINRSLPDGNRGIKIIPKYDDKGIRNEDDWYNPSGTLYCKIQMKHNELGTIDESKTFNAEGKLIHSISSYSYNDSGDIKECVYYKPDGSVQHTQSYKYNDLDEEGNWRTSIVLKNNIPVQIIKREIEYLRSYTYEY